MNDGNAEFSSMREAGLILGPLFLGPATDPSLSELMGILGSMDAASLSESWRFGGEQLAEADFAVLTSFAANLASGGDEGLCRSIQHEYSRLFQGPNRLEAPPWGSVYTDRDCVVFGESTMSLRSWMRRNGIMCTAEDNGPDDHMGKMLILLSWLADNRPELVPEFLSEHLLTWSHHYFEQLEKAAQMDFYRVLARLADATLEGMRESLELEVRYPRFYR